MKQQQVAGFALVSFLTAVSCTRTVPERAKARTTDTVIRQSPVADSLNLFLPPRQEKQVHPEPGQDSAPEPEKPLASDNVKEWSVVAATLSSLEAAERRARGLREVWNQCGCTVFPKNESAHYFVVVGTNLNRAAADQLRDRAMAAGLPGDTYVTKLITP